MCSILSSLPYCLVLHKLGGGGGEEEGPGVMCHAYHVT